MSGRAAVWAYRLLAALPFRAAQGIGAFAGGLAGAWPSRLRRVAETNLELCMPELDPAARARLARSSLIETGKAAAESSPLLLRAPERALRLVRAVHGEEVLEAALAGGRGAILAVPHLGAWEAVGVYCASRYPMTSMYRPQHRTPALDALLRRGRERAGARLVPSNARGVRALYRGLERGELV
ncbi:MAG: lipid A biosynthesis acyltransferase, partial [Gammaproteobacteria bacterium]|nr:lipid A biosynthesis acyltransferase [Gammaproteobacteria bacterium]